MPKGKVIIYIKLPGESLVGRNYLESIVIVIGSRECDETQKHSFSITQAPLHRRLHFMFSKNSKNKESI